MDRWPAYAPFGASTHGCWIFSSADLRKTQHYYRALEHVGISIAFSWPATVIAATVIAFPLMYRTTLGAFDQVNPTLLQAARTLGASEWAVFRRVLLPLAGPGVIAGTVLAFARALGEFGATLMLAGNIPGRTQTMPIAIFSSAEAGDMHTALAMGLLDRDLLAGDYPPAECAEENAGH